MLELHPFDGHVVTADRAAAVVTPPYDAIPDEVKVAVAASDPDSYLGALPPASIGPADLDAALARCRTRLGELLDSDRYRPLDGPCLAVLAIGSGPDRAVAVVGDVDVAAFADGRVAPHEQVRPDRVAELRRYLEVVGVASSPVALTQRPSVAVDAATAPVTSRTPDLAFRGEDGVDLARWDVPPGADRDRLAAAVTDAGSAFVADGHHRAAAAAAHAARTGAEPGRPAARVLVAVLPSDHLDVAAFHRRVDHVPPGAIDRVRAVGTDPRAIDGPAPPDRPGHVTLCVDGRWWRLDLAPLADDPVAPLDADPVEALDVRAVERDLVPVLAGADAGARTGAGGRPGDRPHVVPVAPPLGLGALDRPGAIGIALHPPTVEVILELAAAGHTVPPKTTYVTPKLRSGLVVTPRDP